MLATILIQVTDIPQECPSLCDFIEHELVPTIEDENISVLEIRETY